MSLESYCNRKVIVMNAMATAHEAARAMARHQMGAILVGEYRHVEGIVTDRDLALAVVGTGADPKKTTLEDVMSYVFETVAIDATVDDVVQAMLRAASRRVPISDRGRAVGIVTLDDLIADRAIGHDAVESVVRTQLEVASLFSVDRGTQHDPFSREERARLRHERRAENTFIRMVNAVQTNAGLSTRERAATALGIVLGAICRRLTPSDAKHLLAELPFYLRETLKDHVDGPDRKVSAGFILATLTSELGLLPIHAEGALDAIGGVIGNAVSSGEVRLPRSHLPADLKDLLPARLPHSAA